MIDVALQALFDAGTFAIRSHRESARRLGIFRSTVRRYLRSETMQPGAAERRCTLKRLVWELAHRKVSSRVCIDRKPVVPDVPSGVIEVSRLQAREGYGYLKP